MKPQKAVRLIKKVRLAPSQWKFVTIPRSGNRYIWDPRPGVYFLEWWEGRRRRRERAGESPSEALDALRRKRYELDGATVLGSSEQRAVEAAHVATGTRIPEAALAFLSRVHIRSPANPVTRRRYQERCETSGSLRSTALKPK